MSLGLGVIGVILPVLPTTPCLLIASFCFLKGSKRMNSWFKGTKLYKQHLEQFIQERAMSLRQKITILVVADMMILIPFICVDNLLMRGALIMIMLVKLYYFTFKIKTIPPKKGRF